MEERRILQGYGEGERRRFQVVPAKKLAEVILLEKREDKRKLQSVEITELYMEEKRKFIVELYEAVKMYNMDVMKMEEKTFMMVRHRKDVKLYKAVKQRRSRSR